MADKVLKTKIVPRHDSKSNWQTNNPVLLLGELGIEFDPDTSTNSYTVKVKVGDGTTAWNGLPYLGGDSGTVVLPVPDGTTIVDDDNAWSIAGFNEAGNGTYPIKNASGAIEWIDIPDVYTKAEIDGMLSGAYHYKGTYTDLSALNAAVTAPSEGDVYNLSAPAESDVDRHGVKIKPGDNVAWDGTGWDVLGGTNDMSAYYTAEQVDEKLVKSSSANNQVTIETDKTMTVNSLSTDKLYQGDDILVLDGGTSAG